jgi:hypothetical protein
MIACRFGAQVGIPIYLEDGAYVKAEGCKIPKESCLVKSDALLDLALELVASEEDRAEEAVQQSQIMSDLKQELAGSENVKSNIQSLIVKARQWRN